MMTLHNAKGLEYPGRVPHRDSRRASSRTSGRINDPDQLEEERRLAYVGITRAQSLLYLTHAWSRSLWGGTNYNPPSRFIGEIPTELVDVLREAESATRAKWVDVGRVRAATSEARCSRTDSRPRRAGRPRPPRGVRRGTVVEVKGSGSDTEVTVHFDDEGTKRLVLAYANLTKA